MSSWKNSKSAFDQQLERNLLQLKNVNTYPSNWSYIMKYIDNFINKENQVDVVVELGCGVGALSMVINKYFPELKYFGYDYAPYAIKLANKNFAYPPYYVGYTGGAFCNAGYERVGKNGYENNTIVIANALCDVMKDGDEVFEDILKQGPKQAIFSRMKVVEGKSYAEAYTAYNCVDTFAFYHNREGLFDTIEKYGYTYLNEVVNDSWELAIWK